MTKPQDIQLLSFAKEAIKNDSLVVNLKASQYPSPASFPFRRTPFLYQLASPPEPPTPQMARRQYRTKSCRKQFTNGLVELCVSAITGKDGWEPVDENGDGRVLNLRQCAVGRARKRSLLRTPELSSWPSLGVLARGECGVGFMP